MSTIDENGMDYYIVAGIVSTGIGKTNDLFQISTFFAPQAQLKKYNISI